MEIAEKIIKRATRDKHGKKKKTLSVLEHMKLRRGLKRRADALSKIMGAKVSHIDRREFKKFLKKNKNKY